MKGAALTASETHTEPSVDVPVQKAEVHAQCIQLQAHPASGSFASKSRRRAHSETAALLRRVSLTLGTIKPKNSIGSSSDCPAAFRLVFAASRRNSLLDTPGISTGDWKLRRAAQCVWGTAHRPSGQESRQYTTKSSPHEDPFLGSFFGLERQQVLPFVCCCTGPMFRYVAHKELE